MNKLEIALIILTLIIGSVFWVSQMNAPEKCNGAVVQQDNPSQVKHELEPMSKIQPETDQKYNQLPPSIATWTQGKFT